MPARLTVRTLLAGTTVVGLVAGALLVVQPWSRGRTHDVVLVGDRPSMALPVQPSPTPTAVLSQPSARVAALPAWERIELTAPQAPPACPKTQVLPTPTSSALVAERGSEVDGLVVDGNAAALGFFPREVANRSSTYVQGLDLTTGRLDKPLAQRDFQVVTAGGGRAWGVDEGPGLGGVRALDLQARRAPLYWPADELAAGDPTANPFAIAVSHIRAFVLSLGSDTWLAAVDPASRRPTWAVPLGVKGPDAFSVARNAFLTTDGGEAFVAVPDAALPGIRVLRVDELGHVRARAAVVVARAVMDPMLVAGPAGVYVSVGADAVGRREGMSYLLRLDRSTLQMRAKTLVPGWAHVDRGDLGLWSSAVACDRRLLSKYNPKTLARERTYDVHPDSFESHLFNLSGKNMVVAYKRKFEDTDVVVESYDNL